MWLVGMMGAAHAGGLAVGGLFGLELATGGYASEVSQTELNPGVIGGLIVGYRADVVGLHLQPEVQAAYATATRDLALALGGAVTFSSPVAFGVAAHVGTAPGQGLRWDALGVLEVDVIPKIKPGFRIGVQKVTLAPGGSWVFPVFEGVVIVAF